VNRSVSHLPLPDSAVRQAIDAEAVFLEWLRATQAAKKFAGGMYFKREGSYEYLVKTSPDNRQSRLGPRDEKTEVTLRAFAEGKLKAETRLKSLRETLRECERMNKALRVGRVPNVVVDVLNELELGGLGGHFTVVGTHALYAYETAASVRIEAGALATQDVDLLWDALKRVQFASTMAKLDSSMLKLLQRADPSFQRKEGQMESAVNDKGFMVDFLRRMATDEDPHPFRFTDEEDDLWPVQAQRAEAFLDAPRYERVVFSTTGRMALMRTVSPPVFVAFKHWMAELDSRPPGKRRRDRLQADLVQQLLDEGALPP
jgi:hypothetical protein